LGDVGYKSAMQPFAKLPWTPATANFGDHSRIFGVGEARHFKFGMPINRDEYCCMRDRLSADGVCYGSRDLFKFW